MWLEDRKRSEEQFKAYMEVQREQMQSMTADVKEQRKTNEATAAMNQRLTETIMTMHESMEKKDDQITELQNEVAALASRKPQCNLL